MAFTLSKSVSKRKRFKNSGSKYKKKHIRHNIMSKYSKRSTRKHSDYTRKKY